MSAKRLSSRILLGLVLGVLVGAALNIFSPELAAVLDRYLFSPVGQGFLRLIQFVVVPLVFAALVLALENLRGTGRVERYAGRLVLLYVVSSAVALSVGIGTALILQPGAGLEGSGTEAAAGEAAPPLTEWLVGILPSNPFEALATGNLLQVIVSAVLVGAALGRVGEAGAPFVAFVRSLYEVSLKVLELVLYAVPFGVFALIASVVATQGLGLLARLGVYVFGLVLAIFLMALVYAAVLATTGSRPGAFFRSFTPALTLAFGTASSNAALPLVLGNAERYGLRGDVRAFAIPFGTALKRDGAAILQGFNAVFVAQLYGVPLTPALVGAVFVSALLVSFSTAGVPGSGIIMMTTVLGAAGLPLEGVALVAGIDRFTDGFRTALNVLGNAANAALLGRWEAGSGGPQAPGVNEFRRDEASG